jgi:deoxyribodipyrimidine photo-lyase
MAPQPVVPVFIFPSEQIDSKKNKYFSHAAVQFMCESLVDVNNALEKLGSKLHLIHSQSQSFNIVQNLAKIHAHSPIATITQNRDFSVYAMERDAAIAKWCASHTPPIVFNNDSEDYDLVGSKELLLDGDRPYTVLSAYYKRFIKEYEKITKTVNPKKLGRTAFTASSNKLPNEITVDAIKAFYEQNPKVTQLGGRVQGLKALARLSTLKSYDHDRNYPSIAGTTMMSAHLKFGTVSIREMCAELIKVFGKPDNSLMRELVFRSFYIKICIARPGLQRSESFRQDIDNNIKWREKDDSLYKQLWTAWQEGKTGFPLVDAGMRQLKETGHMHGRVRMVAATVLTRYFLIDWREGARFFAQHLVDYDPCSNNMGWQFSSALGENTQNVYRSPMNPFLQSKTYDTEATYIKQWIPELRDTASKQIHAGTWDPQSTGYTLPIVNQKEASRNAVTMWKKAITNK